MSVLQPISGCHDLGNVGLPFLSRTASHNPGQGINGFWHHCPVDASIPRLTVEYCQKNDRRPIQMSHLSYLLDETAR